MLLVSVFFLIILQEIQSQNASAVTRLENLIKEQIAESYVYPLPKSASRFRPNSNNQAQDYGTFDYVIIGSGSAGSVITNRLSENEQNTVLLLEAGEIEDTFSEIPGLALFLQGLQYNWNFNSTPQTNFCLGSIRHECPYARGLAIGGTSVINGLQYVRGNRLDFDEWCNQGNPGWCYEDVLPFFKKSEHSNIPDGDPGYHGNDGPQNVEYTGFESPQLTAFLDANLELGIPIVDYNGRRQLGASLIQHNSINGTRQSNARAFLAPIRNRTNLTIRIRAYVIKILIGASNKTAYAVVFARDKQLHVAYARKEVILSAGVFGSPQILMLSGIGPAKHLRRHGIRTIQSLRVGNNLQDQLAYSVHFVVGDYAAIGPANLTEYVAQFLDHHGPLTLYATQEAFAFYQTKLETRPGYPDIQIAIAPSNTVPNNRQRVYHLTEEAYEASWGILDARRSFAITLTLLHPKSSGSVRLKSNDPYEYPIINPRLLTDPRKIDIETMRLGIELVINLVNTTKAFQALNATLAYNPLPQCIKNHAYLSKDYWYCQIMNMGLSAFHPTSTCSMGPDPNKGAVVNHELKVHGIKRLRVVDGSVLPKSTSGNPNAPTVMVAEKAAYMILNGQQSSESC